MKLWQKETDLEKLPAFLEEFTIGSDKEFDLLLAKYDVEGSLAHAKMLASIGLLSREEVKDLEEALHNILQTIEKGRFSIDEGVEDVHSQIELLLTRKLGETGKKIHSGRSRNDQVLLDIKLFLRTELKEIAKAVKQLFEGLLTLSEQHKDKLMPGYTHFQVAMPSSFGLWFSAYAESLAEDMGMLTAAYALCNKNPLGSAAGYGSSFPLDREMVTKSLGFKQEHINVINAQMSRGKTEKWVSVALSAIAATLSKLSYDIILYSSANYGFISFPDSLTTGSSIMPHKKNPDVFELIRARCNRIQSLPNELTILTNNLPSGYHRDMQLTKEILFPALKTMKSCLAAADFMLTHIQINPDILADEKYDYLFSVEKVNEYVLQGVPFREAYKKVAEEIKLGIFEPPKEVLHTHKGSIGSLCLDEIREMFEKAMTSL
jgi:argininosuccinate lyase